MAIDEDFLNKLFQNKYTRKYYKKYETIKLEEDNLKKEEDIVSKLELDFLEKQQKLKDESGISFSDYTNEEAKGVSIDKYLDVFQLADELEVRKQVEAMLKQRKNMEARKTSLIARKKELENQIKELKKITQEAEKQNEKVEEIKKQIRIEEKDIERSEKDIRPKKNVQVKIDGHKVVVISTIIGIILLILSILLGMGLSYTYYELDKTTNELVITNKQLQDKEGNLEVLTNQLRNKENDITESNKRIQNLENEVNMLKNTIRVLQMTTTTISTTTTLKEFSQIDYIFYPDNEIQRVVGLKWSASGSKYTDNIIFNDYYFKKLEVDQYGQEAYGFSGNVRFELVKYPSAKSARELILRESNQDECGARNSKFEYIGIGDIGYIKECESNPNCIQSNEKWSRQNKIIIFVKSNILYRITYRPDINCCDSQGNNCRRYDNLFNYFIMRDKETKNLIPKFIELAKKQEQILIDYGA